MRYSCGREYTSTKSTSACSFNDLVPPKQSCNADLSCGPLATSRPSHVRYSLSRSHRLCAHLSSPHCSVGERSGILKSREFM
ncbi:hypothetical protein PanWU01x14_260590 [Parasponia andersonii]|uniref:Uncharacterized protein n=1 Tax=Parasponia andersonii TaxID=3476 RepID=A0A2P5B8W6_PARAD|nr:hypothetical protein PanWU01x14_260590 [Parasponia andersonii]